MTNHNVLSPDLVAQEALVNDVTDQILFIDSVVSAGYMHLQAFKRAKQAAYYSFGWGTTLSPPKAAAVICNADRLTGFDATAGKVRILEPGGEVRFDWIPSIPLLGETTDSSDTPNICLADAQLIKLDAGELGAISWEAKSPLAPETMMAVVSNQPIDSPWIHELYEKTVDEPSNELITRNLGVLVTTLNTFMELPFGKISLENGFTEGAQ